MDDSFSKLHERAKNLKVLYAEDSPTIRHALTKEFQKYFNHIDTAADGKEALLLYLQHHDKTGGFYDIVFSDLEMPRMDGEALSRTILDLNPKQELVIISSIDDYHRIIDLVNLGIKKFLAKPIDLNSLHDSIVQVADSIRAFRIAQEEMKELEEHNKYLKHKEQLYLEKLTKNLQTLNEFNDALNESGIVSKTDPSGKIIYVNDMFCKLSGYTQDELIGNTHRMVSSMDMASSFYAKLWNTISSGKSHHGVFKNRSKRGEIYFVEMVIKPILDNNGGIVEYISVGHNITSIMESLEATKKTNEAKESFFRNISHEMRTPLNAISGLVSLLQRRLKDDQKSMPILETINQSTAMLSLLIESIIDIQNLNNGKLVLEPKEFFLSSIADGCGRFFNDMASEKEIDFSVEKEFSDGDLFVGDFGRITQILKILLSNAFKFNKPNGSVVLTLKFDGVWFSAAIKDSGIGIAKEHFDDIFNMNQTDSSLIRSYEGSGMGLFIAKALASKMHGKIEVKSELGIGSVFTLLIPMPTA